jgi:hypothetical protein
VVFNGTVNRITGFRRLLRLTLGLTASLLVAVVIAEATLRLFRYRSQFLQALLHSPADGLRYDHLDTVEDLLAAAPFRPLPFHEWGGYKLDSHGFRTPEYTRAKPPGTYRILAVGDSFTFSSGLVPLDQMWHIMVGEELRENISQQVEVINLGVPGVGPRFELRLFEVEGRHLAPDLVLLGFFVGNDLVAETAKPYVGTPVEQWSLTWRFFTRLPVVAHESPGFRAKRRRWQPSGFQEGVGPGGYPIPGWPAYDRDHALVSREAFLRVERQRSFIFEVRRRRQVEEWIADVIGTVGRLDGAVHDAGAHFVVMIIPDVMQVDASVRQAVVRTKEADYDFDWVQRAIMHHLTEAGIACVDLLAAFRAAPQAPHLYRKNDTHWSDIGNALAAKRVTEFLRANPGVCSKALY